MPKPLKKIGLLHVESSRLKKTEKWEKMNTSKNENFKVVSGMLTTRYFYRWLFPVIIGVVVGYALGFLGQTLLPGQCAQKNKEHHRKILTKPAVNKTIEIYK